jgi:hypothetical protein
MDRLMYTIYLNDSNQVSIICPKCKSEENIDTTNLKDTQKVLRGECRCGEPYQYNIEFRKEYRKDVSLTGEYFMHETNEKGEIIIRDLSESGMQFECLNPHYISKNDVLTVRFKLDNSNRSEVRKHVKVIWERDRTIGARFIETKFHKEDLESYLRI